VFEYGDGKFVPAEFPPPVDAREEFVKRGLDGEDERIEIGVAIVGGGTAGLACANRLLQLLADDPETMEKLKLAKKDLPQEDTKLYLLNA